MTKKPWHPDLEAHHETIGRGRLSPSVPHRRRLDSRRAWRNHRTSLAPFSITRDTRVTEEHYNRATTSARATNYALITQLYRQQKPVLETGPQPVVSALRDARLARGWGEMYPNLDAYVCPLSPNNGQRHASDMEYISPQPRANRAIP